MFQVHCLALESVSVIPAISIKNTSYPFIAHFTSTVQIYTVLTPTCLPRKGKLFLTPSINYEEIKCFFGIRQQGP